MATSPAATPTGFLNKTSGAAGLAQCVQEGPGGGPSLRVKVTAVSGAPWHLQLFQGGLRVEKERNYLLTFWARSDRAGVITVNCMQNHAPWDHHRTQQVMALDVGWKRMQFMFTPPWDDDNARVCFTNLGTAAGQVYWFADCSLVATAPR